MLKRNIFEMLEHRQFPNNLLESDSWPTAINFVCIQTSEKRRAADSEKLTTQSSWYDFGICRSYKALYHLIPNEAETLVYNILS